MKYIICRFAILLTFCCIGCHSIKIDQNNMHTAIKTPVALGVIGLQKQGLYNAEFKVSAIPEYKKQIRANSTMVDFNKTTFNAYLKKSKENVQNINYADSLKNKPRFVTIDLLDRITAITELQKQYNAETYTYLKGQKKAVIVTSISLALSETRLKQITDAETIFLSNSSYKQYALSLFKDGKLYQTINFSETTIFAYKLSFFCWSENDRRQIALADIIDEKSSCPKNAYRDAIKAEEKMKFFKL